MNTNRIPKRVFICILVAAGFLLSVLSDAEADFIFGTPTNLGPKVNSSSGDGGPGISADGLSLYFTSLRGGAADLWVATRESINDDWEVPVSLGPTVNNSAAWDGGLSISNDGLELYFASNRTGGSGGYDLWVTRRATRNDSWGAPVNLGPNINTSVDDTDVCISADGLSLFIESYRNGGHGSNDLWVTNRATTSDPWGELMNLGPAVNSSRSDGAPSISADGLVLFFSDHPNPRPGGYGSTDIWMMRRATTSDPWGEPINLGPIVNSSSNDQGPNISSDGSTLYFFSRRPGGYGDFDLWQVPIEPVVDFNRDGNVDSADLCILFDCWGTNESLCDIGPTPLGDGIVDIKDMKVFAEYLLGETLPLDLIAHWALDEVEGIYTQDSVGENDAIVIGSPILLSTGGMVDGAFEFNGIMDCLITDSVLNPEDGPFRVFAWIKGGAPGQVVMSQSGGVNWLAMDESEGNLMTELAGSGPNSSPLLSQTTVTDGKWHLIGLVWDGSHRTLYVDNTVAAQDEQDSLIGSNMGLYIGAGKMMQPGAYFSGLIDDVRLYSRAMSP
jgi:hypothetical protein